MNFSESSANINPFEQFRFGLTPSSNKFQFTFEQLESSSKPFVFGDNQNSFNTPSIKQEQYRKKVNVGRSVKAIIKNCRKVKNTKNKNDALSYKKNISKSLTTLTETGYPRKSIEKAIQDLKRYENYSCINMALEPLIKYYNEKYINNF